MIAVWRYRLAIWTLLALLAPLQQVAGQGKPVTEGGMSSYFFSDMLKLEWPAPDPNCLDFNIVKVNLLNFPKDLKTIDIYLKSIESPAPYHWEIAEASSEVLEVVTQQEEGATRIRITLGDFTKSSDGLLLSISCLDAEGTPLPIRQAARKGIVVTIDIDWRIAGIQTEEKRVEFEDLQERPVMPKDTTTGLQEEGEEGMGDPLNFPGSPVAATPTTLGAHTLLEIRDLNGRYLGKFLEEGHQSERTALQNLAPGIYLIVDPLGTLPTRKVWKIQD